MIESPVRIEQNPSRRCMHSNQGWLSVVQGTRESCTSRQGVLASPVHAWVPQSSKLWVTPVTTCSITFLKALYSSSLQQVCPFHLPLVHTHMPPKLFFMLQDSAPVPHFPWSFSQPTLDSCNRHYLNSTLDLSTFDTVTGFHPLCKHISFPNELQTEDEDCLEPPPSSQRRVLSTVLCI